ncbi:MAG: transcription termination/antitermination protein NusG [Alphaproteobacteria bacterium]|nr:transcription termination/antitermination protein NusG [Alphaproteobacteria bacterium]
MTALWYVIHVHSGSEQKVAAAIREQADRQGVGGLIEEISVPMEKVAEIRRGRRVTGERKFFPGYVLIKMETQQNAERPERTGSRPDDRVWHLVKNTPKVTGFLGGGGNRPLPISDPEANRILYQVSEGVERPRPSVIYDVGEQVRVSDGPFTSFTGVVEEVDEERARLKVSVSIFGRATPVDLEYSQVEKT